MKHWTDHIARHEQKSGAWFEGCPCGFVSLARTADAAHEGMTNHLSFAATAIKDPADHV